MSDASPRAVEGYYRRAVRAVTAQCRVTLNQARCGLRRDLATREVPVECGVEAGARGPNVRAVRSVQSPDNAVSGASRLRRRASHARRDRDLESVRKEL